MDYASVTDWIAYIRDCIEVPARHPELGSDTLTVEAGLSKIGDELSSTPYGAAFSDAALWIIETGSADEIARMLQVTLRPAPNAAKRIAALLPRWRGTPLEDHAHVLLRRGLEADPRDPDLVQAADDFARIDAKRAIEVVQAANPLNYDLVARHVGALSRATDPSGEELRFLALRTKPEDLPRLLDAIATAGADHVERFTASLRAVDAPERLLDRVRPLLAAHPAFAGRER